MAGEVLHHDGCLELHGGVQAAPAGQVQRSATLVILERQVGLVADQDLNLGEKREVDTFTEIGSVWLRS